MIRDLIRDVPVLRDDQTLGSALRKLLERGLPALPVVDNDGRYLGVFGEREVLAMVFPGYLKTLKYAGFLPDDLDAALESRREALDERIGDAIETEHVDLPPGASKASLAETFLHHHASVVPVVDEGRVLGVVTRKDFFRLLADQVLAG